MTDKTVVWRRPIGQRWQHRFSRVVGHGWQSLCKRISDATFAGDDNNVPQCEGCKQIEDMENNATKPA